MRMDPLAMEILLGCWWVGGFRLLVISIRCHDDGNVWLFLELRWRRGGRLDTEGSVSTVWVETVLPASLASSAMSWIRTMGKWSMGRSIIDYWLVSCPHYYANLFPSLHLLLSLIHRVEWKEKVPPKHPLSPRRIYTWTLQNIRERRSIFLGRAGAVLRQELSAKRSGTHIIMKARAGRKGAALIKNVNTLSLSVSLMQKHAGFSLYRSCRPRRLPSNFQ